MKTCQLYLALSVAVLAAGCSNIERSRNLADPNVDGKVLAEQVCSMCHGLDGNSTSPAFPRLAGQPVAYIANQLKAFRSHSRSDPAAMQYMWGLSRFLTDLQIVQLAAYYAQQSPSSPRQVDAKYLASGKEIFEHGVKGEKVVPACSECHGPNAQGNEAFPRLANQHADYILKQLAVFQSKTGRLDTPMDQVAPHLTDEQKQAIAAYLQAFNQARPSAAD